MQPQRDLFPHKPHQKKSEAADEWILLVDPSIDTTQKQSRAFNEKKRHFFPFFQGARSPKADLSAHYPAQNGKVGVFKSD